MVPPPSKTPPRPAAGPVMRIRPLPLPSPSRRGVGSTAVVPRKTGSFDMDNSSASSSRSPTATDVSDGSILKGAELIRRQIVEQNRLANLDSDEDRLVVYEESEITEGDEILRLIQQQEQLEAYVEEQQEEHLSRSSIERMEDDRLDGLIRRVSSVKEDAKHVLGFETVKQPPKAVSDDDWSDPFRSRSPLTAADQTLVAPSEFSRWSSDGDATVSRPSDESSNGQDKPARRRFSEPNGEILSTPRAVYSEYAPEEEVESLDVALAVVPPPVPPPADDTPVTLMGRGKSLRLKIHTYHVQRTDEMGDSDSYGEESVEDMPTDPNPLHEILDAVDQAEEGPGASYIPKQWQMAGSLSLPATLYSPTRATQSTLSRDPAYQHAQRAGLLWQTLVGQHVRFPSSWWNGSRSPPMGMVDDTALNGRGYCEWDYVSRHRQYSNSLLTRLVRNRGSAGQLLLHIVVRDLVTWLPVQDIAIGVYHPNARGIRQMEKADMKEEDCRVVWMAVRKRTEEDFVSVVDPLLTSERRLEDVASGTPLRERGRVTNANMRAVYGDKPPLRTVFILESELYERMTMAREEKQGNLPTLVLLREFLPDS